VRADDLETDALDCLQRFAPENERHQHEIAQRRVLEQQRPQRLALDRDVAQRLGYDSGDERGLPGQKIKLAEKARRPVTRDLVAAAS
jgi:hypothetical protein